MSGGYRCLQPAGGAVVVPGDVAEALAVQDQIGRPGPWQASYFFRRIASRSDNPERNSCDVVRLEHGCMRQGIDCVRLPSGLRVRIMIGAHPARPWRAESNGVSWILKRDGRGGGHPEPHFGARGPLQLDETDAEALRFITAGVEAW